MSKHTLRTLAQLRAIYGEPSGRAIQKDIGYVDPHAAHFISQSPFVVLATHDQSGRMDASPRGGEPGFVLTEKHRLFLPDFKGNNRIDSLVNIMETGQVGLLFLIPGIDETLRVNGTASISVDPQILQKFAHLPKPPISCLVVEIKELFLHCAKAFMRSQLWNPEVQTNPKDFPSIGTMIKDQINSSAPAESREDMIKRYQQDL